MDTDGIFVIITHVSNLERLLNITLHSLANWKRIPVHRLPPNPTDGGIRVQCPPMVHKSHCGDIP